MATLTALRPGFFAHQFRAGFGLWTIPVALFGLVCGFGGPFLGGWLACTIGPAVGVLMLMSALVPNPEAFQTYGMNAARQRQQMALPLVPVAGSILIWLWVMQQNLQAVAGTLAVLVVSSWFFIITEPPAKAQETRSGKLFALKATKPLTRQLYWEPALVLGLAMGLASSLFLGLYVLWPEQVTHYLITVPFFVFWVAWFWLLRARASRETAKTYGLTRRFWVSHVTSAGLASSLLLIVGMLPGLLLIDVPLPPLITLYLIGLASTLLLLIGGAHHGALLAIMVTVLMWAPMREVTRAYVEGTTPFATGVLIMSAVAAVLGVIGIARCLNGASNVASIRLIKPEK